MKAVIFFALGFIHLVSCTAQDIVLNSSDLNNKKEVLTEYSKRYDILSKLSDLGNFEYSRDEESEQGYLYGTAVDNDGNNVVFRISANESEGQITLRASGGTAESCSGHNCEQCAFASSGGCTCKKAGSISGGSAYCNHSISR